MPVRLRHGYESHLGIETGYPKSICGFPVRSRGGDKPPREPQAVQRKDIYAASDLVRPEKAT